MAERDLYQLVVRMEAENRRLHAELRRSQREIRRFERQTRKNLTNVSGAFKSLQSVAVGALSGLSFAQAVNSITQVTQSIQSLEARLIAATDRPEMVAEQMQFLRMEADRLGLNFEVLATSFAKFAASTRGTVLEGKQARDIFIQVSEATSALQMSAADTEGVFLALSQMLDKGVVSAEELRGQFGERVSGAFRIAAQSIGKTTEELGKMLKQGSLIATNLIPALAEGLAEVYAPAVEASARSLTAETNRLRNAFFDLKAEISEGGIGEVITNITRAITQALRESRQEIQGFVDFFEKGFVDRIISIEQRLRPEVATELKSFGQEIEDFVNRIVSTFERSRETEERTNLVTLEEDRIRLLEELASAKMRAAQTREFRDLGEFKAVERDYNEIIQRIDELQEKQQALTFETTEFVGPPEPPKRTAREAAIKSIQERESQLAQNKAAEQAAKQAEKSAREEEKRLSSLMRQDELLTSQADKYRAMLDPTFHIRQDMEEIARLQATGDLGLTEANLALQMLAVEMENVQGKTEQTRDRFGSLEQTIEQMAFAGVSAFEDMLVEMEGLREIVRALAKDLLRLVIRQTVTKNLFNVVQKGVQGLFQNQHGGLYRVAGQGSKERPVALSASPGETVRVYENQFGGLYRVAGGGSRERPVTLSASPGETISVSTKTESNQLYQNKYGGLYKVARNTSSLSESISNETKLYENQRGGLYKVAGMGSGERPVTLSASPGETIRVSRSGSGRSISISQAFDFSNANPATVSLLRQEAENIKNATIATFMEMRSSGAIPNF